MRKSLQAVLGAAFGLLAIATVATPARADWEHGGGRGDWGREHEWRQHDWREHEWRRWHQAQEPYLYAPPPPVVYAPRPRFYAPWPRPYAPPVYSPPGYAAPGYYGD